MKIRASGTYINAKLLHTLCSTFILLFPAAAFSQTSAGSNLLRDIGIVQDTINPPFDPSASYLLMETAPGKAMLYPATALALPAESSTVSPELMLGSLIPRDDSSGSRTFHYTFLLASAGGSVTASSVKQGSATQLRSSTIAPAELSKRIVDLENQLQTKTLENKKLDESLAYLRKQSSSMPQVKEIMALRLQLEALKNSVEKLNAEADRQRALLELGRQAEDPQEIDQIRFALAADLQEAAKVTANADRLNNRQQEAARQEFLKKVSLVREMENSNPEELARQVLSLRKKRREIENRMGVSPSNGRSDDF